MNITKDLASSIATQIVQPLVNEINSLNVLISETVESEYVITIPTKVLKLCKEFPEYFNLTSYQFYYTGVGLGNLSCFIDSNIPRCNNGKRLAVRAGIVAQNFNI